MNLEPLIAFYQELSPGALDRFPEFYSTDAYFKDPFNEVQGVQAIAGIFAHMFRRVEVPRFVVTERVANASGAMLAWDFHYRVRFWGRSEMQVIRGVSHLKFSADGKVIYHRDYWDAAEELYMKIPILSGMMRCLSKAFAC